MNCPSLVGFDLSFGRLEKETTDGNMTSICGENYLVLLYTVGHSLLVGVRCRDLSGSVMFVSSKATSEFCVTRLNERERMLQVECISADGGVRTGRDSKRHSSDLNVRIG